MYKASSLHLVNDGAPPSNTSSTPVTGTQETSSLLSSMCHTASCEWSGWEETLDHFSTVSGSLLDVDAAADVDFDQFLLADVDDFFEPVECINATPNSPNFAADLDFVYEQEQDLHMLQDADLNASFGDNALVQSTVACKREPQQLPTMMDSTVHCNRKRKTTELYKLRGENEMRKRNKQFNASLKNEIEATAQTETVHRRRYDILHKILEAWNTGGIEDMEEIADNVYENDVTLISPDFSKGLHGVEAVMSHWNELLDAFPDGIMEDYIIEAEEGCNETLKATWTFSGTQIYPFLGVQPRHKKVCINGTSFFTFKGDRIRLMVLSWNLRETLLKLMGVQPDKAESVASISSLNPTVQMPHPGFVQS